MNRLLVVSLSILLANLGNYTNVWAQAQQRVVPKDSISAPSAQAGEANSAADLQDFYKNIIPISPNAASLGSYGEVPVSLYTGTPNINIPLYNLSGIELKLPMSLSYRASGIRVEENASWVGLGWSLEAGGVITRTVRDQTDLSAGATEMVPRRATMPLLSSTQTQLGATFNQLIDVGHTDFEPDVFNYNFMGMSGSFVFDNNGKPKFSNHANYKVTFTTNDLNVPGSFTIVTDNGTIYEFKDIENTDTFGVSFSSAPTAWYLTRITSPTGKEVIDFLYTLEDQYYYSPPRYSKMLTPNGSNSYLGCPGCPPVTVTCTKVTISGKRLQQIVFQGIGSVEFVPSATARLDVGQFGSTNNSKYLDEILVKDLVGTIKKRYDLEYETIETSSRYVRPTTSSGLPQPGYPDASQADFLNYRLYLRSVTDKSSSIAGQQAVYKFQYYDRTASGKDGLPHRLSASQDHWGFYNGRGNIDLWPGFCGRFGGYDDQALLPETNCSTNLVYPEHWYVGAADRSPTFPEMRYGTLQSIQYPTSGLTEFTYESHAYDYVDGDLAPASDSYCIRAESINKAGGLRVKEIKNKINGVSVKNTEYSYSTGVLRALPFYYSYFYIINQKKTVYPDCAVGAMDDYHLYADINCGPVNDVGYRNGSHIGYEEVTERMFSITNNVKTYNGSTVYKYQTGKDNSGGPTYGDKRSYIFKHAAQPLYYEEAQIKTQYTWPYFPGHNLDWSLGQLLNKTVRNSSDQIVSEQTNTYTNDVLTEVPAAKTFVLRPDVDYIYVNYSFIEGWPKQTGQVETTYDVNGQNGISVTKNFNYASTNHKYLTSELSMGSDNALVETEHRYIEDYSDAAMGGLIGTLKTKQMLAKVVDTRTKKRNLVIQGAVMEYNSDGQPAASYILETTTPVTVGFNASTTVPSSLYKKREEYTYSNKRLQTITKYDGAPITYLWGYDYMRTVAEIKNATYAQVTGTGANLAQLNAANPTESSIRSTLSSVRQGLSSALVKSYTHDLVYGVSSVTEPSDLTAYYIYDQSGRLSQLLNNKSQVVKEYAYNYGDGSTSGEPVGNQPPALLSSIPAQSVALNQAYTYTLPIGLFSDPESQVLTYTMNGLPAGLSFSNGAITGTTTASGFSLVTLTATDPGGLSSSISFYLTVSTCFGTDPYIVTGSFSSAVSISAVNRIETDAAQQVLVNPSASLTLKAGQSVKLKAGFVIKPGAAFRAYTGPCN